MKVYKRVLIIALMVAFLASTVAALVTPLSAGAGNVSTTAAVKSTTARASTASTAAVKTTPIVGAGVWRIQTVDSAGDAICTSLQLTTAGWPAISYWNMNNGTLKYAYKDATGWHTETVDSSSGDPGYGTFGTSLALTPTGWPAISYYDVKNKDLKYAYKDASGWHIQTVDSSGDVGSDTSLRLTPTGWPAISYGGNGNLKYAYKDAGGWHIQTVDSTGGAMTSLQLTTAGWPAISYGGWTGTNWDLKYTYKDGSGWHNQVVDSYSNSNVGYYTSLQLTTAGWPAISYYHETNGSTNPWAYDLKYTYKDAGGWHNQVVDSTHEAGLDTTSLQLTSTGWPAISYFDVTIGALKYAYKDALGWHNQVADSLSYGYGSNCGEYSSLQLTSAGWPAISYYGSGPLMYAYKSPS